MEWDDDDDGGKGRYNIEIMAARWIFLGKFNMKFSWRTRREGENKQKPWQTWGALWKGLKISEHDIKLRCLTTAGDYLLHKTCSA